MGVNGDTPCAKIELFFLILSSERKSKEKMLSVCIRGINDNIQSNIKKYGDNIYYCSRNNFIKKNIKTKKREIIPSSLLQHFYSEIKIYEIEICDDVIYVTKFDDEISAMNINNMTELKY